MVKKILFLVPATLAALEQKGVARQILDRDAGYFDAVFTIHLLAPENKIVALNEKNTVIEISVRDLSWLKLLYPLYALIVFVRFLARIAGLIKKEKINLVRSNDPYLEGILGWAAARLGHIPFCVSIHADYAKRYKLDPVGGAPRVFGSRWIAGIIERFVLSHADMVLPIRQSLADYAREKGADPAKIKVIPHGVKTEVFETAPVAGFREKAGLQNKKILCFAGRISKDNYVYDLISLMSRINKKYNDAVLVMIGDGPETVKLKEEIARQGLDAAVKLLGFRSFNEVVEFRKIAAVNLCLMGGFSLIEAALSGNPVIAYDVEWHRELIENNVSGILVQENDIQSLADAVGRLLDDAAWAGKIGATARQMAKDKHSFQLARQIVSGCYRQLIEGHI